jgi:hypothetical protein
VTCETILYGADGPSGRSTRNAPDDGSIFAPCACRRMFDGIAAARRENETGVPVISRRGERTVPGPAAIEGTVTRAGSRRRCRHAAGGGRVAASFLPVFSALHDQGCRFAHPRPRDAKRERLS